jgi:hypothetical protein
VLIRPVAASIALSLAMATSLPALGQEKAQGVNFSATLNGANEINQQGQPNAGDPDGSGTFTARLVPGQGQLCYTLIFEGIDAPTMAHIHTGAAGSNGDVFVPLTDLTAGEHCLNIDRDKATALVAGSGDHYVNLHNAAYPAGAIRGQLEKK